MGVPVMNKLGGSQASDGPIETIATMSEGDQAVSTDAWNQVISAVAQVADNTAQPQIINLSVQLPGGEFKTFVFDIVTRELVGIGGDSSNTSATISIPKDTRTRSKYSRE